LAAIQLQMPTEQPVPYFAFSSSPPFSPLAAKEEEASECDEDELDDDEDEEEEDEEEDGDEVFVASERALFFLEPEGADFDDSSDFLLFEKGRDGGSF